MSTSLKTYAAAVASLVTLLLAGCAQTGPKPSMSNVPKVVSEPVGAPEVVAAKTAFWPMYTAARSWAPDVVVLRVTAKEVPNFKNEAGKAAMWEALFASPSLHQYRAYSYSIASLPPAIHKGVSAGLKMPWAGATRDTMPLDLSLFEVDSDVAYKAAADAAADWLKKNPGKAISALEVDNTYKLQRPVWFLVWGNKQSGYTAFVDASSGKVLKHI